MMEDVTYRGWDVYYYPEEGAYWITSPSGFEYGPYMLGEDACNAIDDYLDAI